MENYYFVTTKGVERVPASTELDALRFFRRTHDAQPVKVYSEAAFKSRAMSTTTHRLSVAIPEGRDNAISRKELAEKLGMSDRKTRSAIEDARAEGLIIINAQDGSGYYQSKDKADMLRQYKQDTARALSIFRRRKPLRKALIEAGVDLKARRV